MNNKPNDVIQKMVMQKRTPGVQYLITKGDSTLFSQESGLSDIEHGTPVGKGTTFNACSVTKTFTALSIMQLVADGTLLIDSNASAYTPYLDIDSEVTIRQLLSHTSGFANPNPLSWIHLQHDDFNDIQFVREILTSRLDFTHKPGMKFRYSNLNYLLLGDIIEQVSKQTYTEYVTKNILNRLNVGKDTLGFTAPGAPRYAQGYQKRRSLLSLLIGWFIDRPKFIQKSNDPVWIKFSPYYINGKAYGGLIANAASLAKFANALNADISPLIDHTHRRMMFTTQKAGNGHDIPMTLGWFTGHCNGSRYYTHAGGGGGYYCELRHYPDKGISSAIMFNRTGIRDERILDLIDPYFL